MLVLTDLTDQDQDPLDWLGMSPLVKHRLNGDVRRKADSVRAVLGGRRPLAVFDTTPPTSLGGWDVLAIVDDATGSQYDALLAATRTRDFPTVAVAALALAGRGFHGNRGRPWHAVRGNLHLSCMLPVDCPVAEAVRAVPAIPAVAVCEAVTVHAPRLRPRIKWVNDVLLDDAKVAGVLAAAQSQGPRLHRVVFGVGLNVAAAPPVRPTPFVPAVTSLADHGTGTDLGGLVTTLLDRLRHHVAALAGGGADGIVDAYRARCDDVGRRVAIHAEGQPDTERAEELAAPVAAGRVVRLDRNLALHVEGCEAPLVGGRLRYLQAPNRADPV